MLKLSRARVIADIGQMAAELGINIYNVEIAHSAEGPRGVLVLVVDTAEAPRLHDAVVAKGHRATVSELS